MATNIRAEIEALTKTKQKKDEPSEFYSIRLFKEVDKIAEDDWLALSEESQAFINTVATIMNKNKRLPDGEKIEIPSLPGGVDVLSSKVPAEVEPAGASEDAAEGEEPEAEEQSAGDNSEPENGEAEMPDTPAEGEGESDVNRKKRGGTGRTTSGRTSKKSLVGRKSSGAARGTGINYPVGSHKTAKPLACKAGSRQSEFVDALSRKDGATMKELRTKFKSFNSDATIKSYLYWSVHVVKGYGIRTEVRKDGTHVYHLALAKGMTKPVAHIADTKSATKRKAAA
jgi:hypothetical protein